MSNQIKYRWKNDSLVVMADQFPEDINEQMVYAGTVLDAIGSSTATKQIQHYAAVRVHQHLTVLTDQRDTLTPEQRAALLGLTRRILREIFNIEPSP